METSKKYHLVIRKKVDKFLISLSNPFYEAIKNAMLALADDQDLMAVRNYQEKKPIGLG